MEETVLHRRRNRQAFVIRPCASLAELDACVALQQQTWGSPEIEVVPRNMFVLAQALGGHVLCAWDRQGALAGYAMGIAAHEPAHPEQPGRWMRPAGAAAEQGSAAGSGPGPYLHSHQVAVAVEYRNEGLGFALKLAQREEALSRNLRMMRWTFDPTMACNAYFNLHRLGAVARLYVPNLYGMLGSQLQGGLPTDRLLAEWPLESERVRQAAERRLPAPGAIAARIALSPAMAAARAAGEVDEGLVLQADLRRELQAAFRSGLELCDFAPDGSGGGEYLLRRCDRPLPQIDIAP